MEDPTIIVGLTEFIEFFKRCFEKGHDVDSMAKEEKFIEFKQSVQAGRLKSASSPSYLIMTINVNSPKKGPGVTEMRRRFVSIIMRSFFSSIIFCQELPGHFKENLVAECGTSGYNFVKNGNESAVIWREEDFHGETKGLETTDKLIVKLKENLGRDASELLSRMAMVKLTPTKSSKESVLAVSWHGPHYQTKNEEKNRVFGSLTAFLDKVIEEKGIPSYIIGGNFNLDTVECKLPKDVVVSNYSLGLRQAQEQEAGGRYISHKDNFIWFPNNKLRVCYVRPFLFDDEGTTTSDFSKDDQAKVEGEMSNATNTPAKPTDMLGHDPIIGVIQFTSSTAVRNLSEDFERALTSPSATKG